jgi:hypothetical protein
MMPGAEMFGSLLLVPLACLAFLPLVIYVIHEVIDASIPWPLGIGILFFALALLVLGLISGEELVIITVLISIVSAVPALRFAQTHLEKQAHRMQDIKDLERVYLSAVQRPDDVGAQFRLAALLYKRRLPGPAIAVASSAAAKISEQVDPLSNVPPRHFFRSELNQLEEWRRRSPEVSPQVACLRCGHQNPSHLLLCSRCQAPFLLDHVRVRETKTHLVPRLFFAWMLITAMLLTTIWLSYHLSRGVLLLAVLGLVALTGLILWRIFRSVEGAEDLWE